MKTRAYPIQPRNVWRGIRWLVLVAVLFVLPLSAYAQGGGDGQPIREVTDDEVNDISSRLYCPVCENVPLDVCGTAACARWRAQVRTLLEQGESEDEVINYFVTQFGQRVVGTPQDPWLNFLAWAVPAGAVIVGAGAVAYLFLRWRRRTSPPAQPEVAVEPLTPDDEYRARLERELRGEE